MTMYSATAFAALPASDVDTRGAEKNLIAVCLVTSVGLLATALVYVLGFGAELTWSPAAG